jgi:hypothetical protein
VIAWAGASTASAGPGNIPKTRRGLKGRHKTLKCYVRTSHLLAKILSHPESKPTILRISRERANAFPLPKGLPKVGKLRKGFAPAKARRGLTERARGNHWTKVRGKETWKNEDASNWLRPGRAKSPSLLLSQSHSLILPPTHSLYRFSVSNRERTARCCSRRAFCFSTLRRARLVAVWPRLLPMAALAPASRSSSTISECP